MKKCIGCGEVLQYKDINKVGYIPESKYSTSNLCQRCFKLAHYGEFKAVELPLEQFDKMYSDISNNPNNVIIYTIDCFNIDGSIVESFKNYFKDNKVIVVVNKIDIMPKSTSLDRITNKLSILLKKNEINYSDIILVSTMNKTGIDKLIKSMKKTGTNSFYFVGNNNTGKSSLINCLIGAIEGQNSNNIVTSFYPGTTLNIIKTSAKGMHFIDTPGLMNTNSAYELLNAKNLKKIIINNEIKPISMTIYNDTSLFIGSVARIDFYVEEKTNLMIYGSSLIKYHKTKSIDLEKKINNIKQDLIFVPKLSKEFEFDNVEYELDGTRKSINLFGLSTIDILNGKGKLIINKPLALKTNISTSIYGGKK